MKRGFLATAAITFWICISLPHMIQANNSSCPMSDACTCMWDATQLLNNITCSYSSAMIGQLLQAGHNLSQPIEIHILDLSSNQIMSLPDDFFEYVESISILDLSDNQMAQFPTNALMSVSVKQLDLSNNKLTTLSLSDIVTFASIESINLSNNELNTLVLNDNETNDSKLVTLNLANNKLTALQANTFSVFKNLDTLDLARNKITNIENEAFSQIVNLHTLDLSTNELTVLNDGLFMDINMLHTLDLSRNSIQKISKDALAGLEVGLLELDLSYNNIDSIIDDALTRLQSLRKLYVQENRELRDIQNVLWPQHLQTLDLSNCAITAINDCNYVGLSDLIQLLLSGNDLSCSCHLQWLYNWYTNRQDSINSISQWTCIDINGVRQNMPWSDNSCLTHESPLKHCNQAVDDNINNQPVDPDYLDLNVSFVIKDGNVHITWAVNATYSSYIHGFLISMIADDVDIYRSEILSRDTPEYAIVGFGLPNSYMVCLDVLQNDTHAILRKCQESAGTDLTMIVGIVAGSIALIPCMFILFYIVYLDKKRQNGKKYDPLSKEKIVVHNTGTMASEKTAEVAIDASKPPEVHINKGYTADKETVSNDIAESNRSEDNERENTTIQMESIEVASTKM